MSGKRTTYLILLSIIFASSSVAQCLSDYSWSFSPEPINGYWNSNEEVTVCLEIDSQDWTGGAHYLHALLPSFGAGWDLSTLTPLPPNSCSGDGGQWSWYTGPVTSAASGMSFGAGFYYESPEGGTDDNDPGDNYGDHCPSQESLSFCFILRTLDTEDCITALDLNITINTYADDQSGGSFLSTLCGSDEQAVYLADLQCCDAVAGVDQSLNLCADAPPLLLDQLVDWSPSGSWHYNDPMNPSLGNSFSFDPSNDSPGDYIYVEGGILYTCQDQAMISISVQEINDAGTGGVFHVCNSGAVINLFDLLANADPGGIWEYEGGVPTDPFFSPSSDPGGTYSYSFPPQGSCLGNESQLDLIVHTSLNPGIGNPVTICPCQGAVPLISLLAGTPMTWGTWTGPDGMLLNDPTFYAGSSTPGLYTYSLNAVNCQSETSVLISEGTLGDPGVNNAVILCPSSTPISSLITFLNGNPSSGGTWTNPTGGVISNGMINPDTANPGPYTYTFTCGPCIAQAAVQVNFTSTPSLSLTGDVIQCNTEPVNLMLDASGTGPFNLTITDENNTSFNLLNQSNGALIPVNSTLSHTYTISSASSNSLPFCGVNIGSDANVVIGPPPSVSISGDYLLCPGQSLEISPILVGNGPFELQLYSSITGLTSTVGPIESGETFTVFPTSAGSYTVQSISDASTPTCSANGTGQASVTFSQAPTASLSNGGGTLCMGEEGTAVAHIDGQWTSYDLTLETSNGPIVIEGVSDNETISFPVPFSTPTNLPYCLSDVSPSGGTGCQANLSDTCMAFIVLPPLITYSLSVNCDDLTQAATISFFIQGGEGNYTVNGTPLSSNFFESQPISNGLPFSFTVSDGMSCGPVIRSGIVECECAGSAAGSLLYPVDTLEICHGENLIPAYSPAGSFLDDNDVLNIVVHDGSAAILGNILQGIPQNGTGFVLEAPLITGQVYYMSAVVGNDDGNGMVNPDDVCLSFSTGIPIVFLEEVVAELSGVTAICEGEEATVSVELSGNGPWEFDILQNGLFFSHENVGSEAFTFTTSEAGLYSVSNLMGGSCIGSSTDEVSITEQDLPTATLGNGGTFCQGSSAGPIVTLTGAGPWNLEYSVNGTSYTALLGNTMDVIPVSESGTYTLTQVSDMNCINIASGSANVTAIAAPAIVMTNSGPVCEGTELILEFELSGTGPWEIALNIDGNFQDTLSYSSDFQLIFAESSEVSVSYLHDLQCPGIDLPQTQIVVNPIPEFLWSLSDSSLCEGETAVLAISPAYDSVFSFDLDQGGGSQSESLDSFGQEFVLSPDQDVVLLLENLTDLATGCMNNESLTIPIEVFSKPEIDLGPEQILCSDDTLLVVSMNQGFEYTWSPSMNLINYNTSMAEFSWVNTGQSTTIEWVVLEADNQGCTSRDSLRVDIIARPQVAFTVNPSTITTVNPVGNFFNQSFGSNHYSWSVEGEFVQNGPWMTHFFPEDVADFYEVCLSVETIEAGCKAILCKDIRVIGELNVFIPNAFSPDGDGLNEEFYPQILNADLSFYNLLIFDRAGQIVYETTNPNGKWNGYDYRGGGPCRAGVYQYLLVARDRFGLRFKEFKGLVTLLR